MSQRGGIRQLSQMQLYEVHIEYAMDDLGSNNYLQSNDDAIPLF